MISENPRRRFVHTLESWRVGYYATCSSLEPSKQHTIELLLSFHDNNVLSFHWVKSSSLGLCSLITTFSSQGHRLQSCDRLLIARSC
jgi:hypothetical protein